MRILRVLGLQFLFVNLVVFSVWAQKKEEEARELGNDLVKRLESSLDPVKGEGTGALMTELEAWASRIAERQGQMSQEDFQNRGLTKTELAQILTAPTGGKPMEIALITYQASLDRGNDTLRASGIDFLTMTQHPAARFIELARQMSARFSTVATEENFALLIRLSHAVYAPIMSGAGETYDSDKILVPLTNPEILVLNERFKRFAQSGTTKSAQFVPDSKNHLRGEEILPRFDKPLAQHQKSYNSQMSWRGRIVPPLAGISTAGGGGFTTPGILTGMMVWFLEWQFNKYSNKWAWVWNKFGIPGNVGVNYLYAAICAATTTLGEIASGRDITTNPAEFLLKTTANTIAFVSSFGASQILTSKMYHEGEISEHPRFHFEYLLVIYAGVVGRALALGGAAMSSEQFQTSIFSIPFQVGTAEMIGWGLQAIALASVTAPLALKRYVWDPLRLSAISSSLNQMGGVERMKGFCRGFASRASKLLTPGRQSGFTLGLKSSR